MEDPPKKRRGRPPKNLDAKALGRPRDPKKAMQAFRERILNSPRSAKVVDAIFKAALDDEHKNQAAAWHILIDRLAPKALFESEITKADSGQKIQVTISTAGGNVNIGEPSEEPKDIEGEVIKNEQL